MNGVIGRVRAHRVLLIVLALFVVLYGVAGFVILPRVLRAQATRYVTQTLHRQLRVADIEFNPFTFTLSLQNLALNEANGAPLVSFAALRVNAELSSIVHRAIVLKEVTLDEPRVRAILAADGDLNLLELVPPESPAEAAPAAPAPAPAASEPIALRIGLLSVRAGRVEFEDHALERPVTATLMPIDFTLRDFRTQAGHENAYRFDAKTLAGEGLAWDGQFTVQPLGSSGNIRVSALKAATIAAWLQDALPFALPSGTLELASHYQVTYGATLGLKLQVPTLALTGFAIAPRSDVSQTWLQFPGILFSDIDVGLAERSVRVGNIAVDNARVQVQRRADGTLNLNELFTPVAAAPAPAATPATSSVTSAAPGTPWSISLGQFALKDAAVEFTDQTLKPAVQYPLQPVSLQIKDYSSAPAHALGVLADIGIGKGALHAEGQAVIDPMSADLKLSATALDLAQLQPYLTQQSDLQLDSGRFTGAFQIQYADKPVRKQPQLRVRGDLQVDDIASKDALQHQDFVSWKQLKVAGIDFQQQPDRWSVEHVTLRDPYARVRIAASGVINISEVLRPARLYPPPPPQTPAQKAAADKQATAAAAAKAAGKSRQKGAAPAAAAAAPAPVTPARLGEITIANGTVGFTDDSLTPQFATVIYNLGGSVKGLSSAAESRATVQMAGSVDRYAPVTIGGEVNLLAASSYTDLTMKFANMDLTTFNPYSGKFAGYNITRGKLTTELHYKIQSRQLAAEHHVILDQLEFGAATESKDAVPLPVKLAVALLKDRNGVIDINLPVGGTLDDPSFRIMPVVWKAVRNLLLKIVTAPFALLGSLFGGGEELSYVDFAPGRFELVPDQAAKLTKLASALTERPQLKLDVPLAAVSAADVGALARAKLEAALPQLPARGKTAAAAPQDEAGQRRERVAKLTALYTTQLGAAPAWTPELTAADPKAVSDELIKGRSAWLEAALLPHYAPAAQDRDALGRARADSVRAALVDVSKIDPERVFLSTEPTTPPAKSGELEGAVRMELKLQ